MKKLRGLPPLPHQSQARFNSAKLRQNLRCLSLSRPTRVPLESIESAWLETRPHRRRAGRSPGHAERLEHACRQLSHDLHARAWPLGSIASGGRSTDPPDGQSRSLIAAGPEIASNGLSRLLESGAATWRPFLARRQSRGSASRHRAVIARHSANTGRKGGQDLGLHLCSALQTQQQQSNNSDEHPLTLLVRTNMPERRLQSSPAAC
jgi:hypothetical protein